MVSSIVTAMYNHLHSQFARYNSMDKVVLSQRGEMTR